jgi:hypothetical protein
MAEIYFMSATLTPPYATRHAKASQTALSTSHILVLPFLQLVVFMKS